MPAIGAFFVFAAEITSRVAHGFDQLEWISVVCRRRPRYLHVKVSFILRQSAFENARCDRARDLAAMARSTLHHHCDHIFRMIEWRETHKPGNVFLVATLGGLRSASFPSHHHIFQTRSATGASIFVNNFPKAFADKLDILRRYFPPQIGSDSRRETHWLALFIKDRRAVLIEYLVDQARVITRPAVRRRDVSHG